MTPLALPSVALFLAAVAGPDKPAPGETAPDTGSAVQAVAGPDLAVGPIHVLVQFGREGAVGSGTVGLAMNTTGCNKGNAPVHWFALPNTDHPLLTGNLYRLRTVAGADRFEQVGYGWIKHGFGAAQDDECGFGCTPFGNLTQLGAGCSDPYSASQLSTACDLSPRSVVNPYTAILPSGGSLGPGGGCSLNYPGNNHNGHVHDGISHRIQVQDVDLIPALNPGARYFGEVHYLVPHEFAAANGNQNNNVSHREFTRIGSTPTGFFGFDPAGSPFHIESPAVDSWPGAYQSSIEPAPLVDGRAFHAFKATPLGGGLWHYEYAIYNMNLDRAIGSFSVPIPAGTVVSNVGFHAPPHHAPETNADNYPNTPWTVSHVGGAITWSTETFAANPTANAIRWGTLYNFRFDANVGPQGVSGTVGLFKTGATMNIPSVGPAPLGFVDCNGNTIDDRCDLSCAPSGCNVPGCGASADCTADGIPDECQADCDGNSQADICELAAQTASDCNQNLLLDSCEPGGAIDCNGNLIPDYCDLFSGTSADANGDLIPDDCEVNRIVWVDDDAANDPGPGSPGLSDPLENGTLSHPFDAVQEGIESTLAGDIVIVSEGTYDGTGNVDMSFDGRAITVRGRRGAENSILDGQAEPLLPAFTFNRGESVTSRLEDLTLLNFNVASIFISGTIDCEGTSPLISRIISRNGAGFVAAEAGASPVISNCRLYDTGFNILGFQSFPVVNDSLIVGGGFGMRIVDGTATVRNTTISDTSGPSILSTDGQFTISNSILRPNGGTVVQVTSGPSPTITFSNVKGGFIGTGNIDTDPLFINPAGEDYHLASGSPSRDTGDPGFVPLPGEEDLDGEARVSGPQVDMGADEYTDCNSNGAPDYQDIAGMTSGDCDRDGVPDECQVTTADCNGNSVWDACDVDAATSPDCNLNGVPDECDVDVGGASQDCNSNLTPDECEPDCNRNGVADACDIGTISQDCEFNGIPDICETDCNQNGIGDACDISGGALDCNANNVPDECETDCNGNSIPDDCDITAATSADCSGNGVPDECEPDCNNNAVPDSCDIVGASDDCDLNGVPDECDLARGAPDCNGNLRYDVCDIGLGSSFDANLNGQPDECDVPVAPPAPTHPASPHNRLKNRYVSFVPVGGGATLAYRVNKLSAPTGSCWADVPDVQGSAKCVASPVFRVWNESMVHVGDCEIMPVAQYEVRATVDAAVFSLPLAVSTIAEPTMNLKKWGDVVGVNSGTEWTPPNLFTNVNDVLAVLAFITNATIKPTFQQANLEAISSTDPCLNAFVNTADVLILVKAVAGDAYPFMTSPASCPVCP